MPDDTERSFAVPDLGEGLEEATIVSWLVAVGDEMALNQPLCVVETAKAEVEIPSPFAGRLLERGGAEGETLPVGALLARIGTAGPPRAAQPSDTGGAGGGAGAGSGSDRTPVLVGYGVDASHDRSRRTGAPVSRAAGGGGATGPDASPGRPLAKPPVRKLARSLGIDLAALSPGSGPGGIVTRDDVLGASARAGSEGSDVAAPGRAAAIGAPSSAGGQAGDGGVEERAGAAAVPSGGARAERAGDETVPVRGVRARIAERMAVSRSRIPDATCSVWADCTELLAVRRRLDAAAQRAGGPPVVTPFALLCRLLVDALRGQRLLNASFVEDVPEIRVHGAVHLGIGTATPRGLVVAVARDADRRSTLDLATEIARLAEAARGGTLAPAEMVGSTFTVSNFGALGLDEGIPVINHPEAAILGIGSVKERPAVVDGAVVARPTASLTLAFDHRVCDGAEAGAFLGHLRDLVEHPELALLHA